MSGFFGPGQKIDEKVIFGLPKAKKIRDGPDCGPKLLPKKRVGPDCGPKLLPKKRVGPNSLYFVLPSWFIWIKKKIHFDALILFIGKKNYSHVGSY